MYKQIDDLKDRLNLLTGEGSDLNTLIDIINLCNCAITNIEKNTHGYYLAMIDEDNNVPDCSWYRYYIPIGETTKHIAKKRMYVYAKKLGAYPEDCILEEISEKVYNDYYALASLTDLVNKLPKLYYSSHGSDRALSESVKEDIKTLREKLNLTYSWQKVVDFI